MALGQQQPVVPGVLDQPAARLTFPDLLGTDQSERRILREPLGIVDILIARDAAVDRLAEQIGEWKLGVLPLSLANC
jgi:hypothetical protein